VWGSENWSTRVTTEEANVDAAEAANVAAVAARVSSFTG